MSPKRRYFIRVSQQPLYPGTAPPGFTHVHVTTVGPPLADVLSALIPGSPYSLVFDAAWSGEPGWDGPYLAARISRRLSCPPTTLVAIISPSLLCPPESQFAIAAETALLVGLAGFDAVSAGRAIRPEFGDKGMYGPIKTRSSFQPTWRAALERASNIVAEGLPPGSMNQRSAHVVAAVSGLADSPDLHLSAAGRSLVEALALREVSVNYRSLANALHVSVKTLQRTAPGIHQALRLSEGTGRDKLSHLASYLVSCAAWFALWTYDESPRGESSRFWGDHSLAPRLTLSAR